MGNRKLELMKDRYEMTISIKGLYRACMQLRLFSDSANFIYCYSFRWEECLPLLDSIYIVHPVSEMKLDDYIVSL